MDKLLATAAAIAALVVVAPPALADDYPPWVLAIRDCAANGKLDGTYRPKDLEKALQKLRGDGNEYSDCANAIRHALDGGSGKTDPPPPNGIVTQSGAVAASAEDVAQLQATIAADAAGEPAPAAVLPAPSEPAPAAGVLRASDTEIAFGGLDRSTGARFRIDTTLLAAVVAAELVVLAGTTGLRHRRRRVAS